MSPKIIVSTVCFLVGIAAVAFGAPEIGKKAPDFTLKSCEGNEHSLSDFKGKVVVLEWTNHGCPFVAKHYGSGNMQKLQAKAAEDGVVWLTICSSAPGAQGHMSAEDASKKCAEVGSKATAYLLDEDGKVGKAYAAKRTPEMFVIDAEGVLIYKGAIDDRSGVDPKEIDGARNYVMEAVGESLAGRPVVTAETDAYGCGIKYKD